MNQAHKHQLRHKLDQLWHEGVVRIDRWEMLAIFEKQRVTIADWRDLKEAWRNMHEDPDAAEDLAYVVIKNGDSQTIHAGYVVFIAGSQQAF
ncbi:hypothetical protein D3X12_15490 [Pseudomonas protegens]|uniref:DUF4258 domain-containing protein n=1 Tax=Pseudomonas protegens TaxID=380021 RepID=A0ABY2VGJ8_9PSED|nr:MULTISPECIES: hypothetical protein [Pseudomonas]ASE24354.1 hypothetical protein CEP86_29290 [Pseudomonas protegens]QEZ52003.1 hypothetical protein D3X12_15490 [Pseudomonas protegens]QEZ55927.1 hypothetical protein D4N38_03985 [Pseudomonas protegens]QEZ63263.1 hypothetical protein D4N37_10815 [Pseudomonas protegens]QIC26850.1 hypothetical protein FQ342_00165 [Pseudomonas protegens]